VLGWVRGTGLRPVLDVLGEADAPEFERQYSDLLREAYPATAAGTLSVPAGVLRGTQAVTTRLCCGPPITQR